MSFKSVLVVIGVDQTDLDINAALRICEEIEAHLAVLVLGLAAAPPVGEFAAIISASWLEERERDIAELAARVGRVNGRLAGSRVSVDVASEYCEQGWTDDRVGRRARYVDLVIIGSELLSNTLLTSYILKGGLFEVGKPIILMPQETAATLRPKRILVAWDAGNEAARAVSEARTLLAGADEVHVVLVDPFPSDRRDGPEPGADIATYLARHGAKVVVDRLPSARRPVSEVLRQHAIDMNADLMVMGAYGHSRLRERLFGGVTRDFITHPLIPILMAR